MRHCVERFTSPRICPRKAVTVLVFLTRKTCFRKGQAPDPPADPAPAYGGRRIEELRIAVYLYSLNTVRTVFVEQVPLEKRGKNADAFALA